MNAATRPVSLLLAEIGDDSAFATRFSIEADPELRVAGIGAVPLPVTAQMAHRLCAVAQPALHGYKDQTRFDLNVRDTWEIPASAIGFGSPQWQATLDNALARIKNELGLPSGAGLKARLHNLLVYAPGQFFAMHQDSEKMDGMLGTLVITLPSGFTGGEFQVTHQGETLRARGSANNLGFLAFYADCHHEVRAVKQGYRVVLTYNLIGHGNALPADVSMQKLPDLAEALRIFWQTPGVPRWDGGPATQAPDRLVYLLDHQYTQSGLSWERLKGVDAARAAALLKVAERLDAEIFLALADVHETWSAEDDYQRGGHWGYDEDEDESPVDVDPDEPILEYLIDSSIELRHWLARDGSVLDSDNGYVDDSELCLTRSSSDCTPFKSEHEGYMGNYGNTVDRWYHRAAVVMWPRERAFIIRARQAPRWAIGQIATKQETGDEAQANAWANGLLPFWDQATRNTEKAHLLSTVVPVAARLGNEDTAARLLAPFSLLHLGPEVIPWLLLLLERHGPTWRDELLHHWNATPQPQADRLKWLAHTLPALAHACMQANTVDGKALAGTLLELQWSWLREYLGNASRHHAGRSLARMLGNTGPAVLGLLRAGRAASRPDSQQSIVDTLLSIGLPASLGVLRAAQPSDDLSGLGLASLHAHCVRTLTARLARPERSSGDWSIPAPELRAGELGEVLSPFLESPERKRLEWPLAKAKRQMIHHHIELHELPVSHQTRRTGRPYTLVLEKTQAVFEHEAAERRQWSEDLDWLRKTAAGFTVS